MDYVLKTLFAILQLQVIQARIIPSSLSEIEIIYNVCRDPKHTGSVSLGNINVASHTHISEEFIRNELRMSIQELQEDIKGEKDNYVNQHGIEGDGVHLCRSEMDFQRRHVLDAKDLNEVFHTPLLWGNANDEEDRIFQELSYVAMMIKVFNSTSFGCCSVMLSRQLHRRVQSALSYTHKLFRVLRRPFPIACTCLQNLTLRLEDCVDLTDAGYILLHHMEKKLSDLIDILH